ncbi:MAG: hypothetical protein M3Y59_06370 [Myxococcota bacterium]|nr:hypothetical protein [Myxococcota bacterium]
MISLQAVLVAGALLVQTAPSSESVATALRKLEAAREQLGKAVQRIEKDPPSNADLEAAHTAVGVLKDAIDAGAAFEAADLGYAKASLAGRKELRERRAYVDQRRANVHIFQHRRDLDAALAKANGAVQRTANKDATPGDFDAAKAQLADLKKRAGDARQFASADPKFGEYLGELDEAVARHQRTLDDRLVDREAQKQRGEVEQARQELQQAMGALSKTSTDAQFETADKAATALKQRLDDGKPLETKHPAYRGDAERARLELAQAQKRMDELLSTAGLERLKAEVEPSHKDLTAALKGLRGRKPTDEQLAEARTAAIVVGKLVEKFQPQASRSQAFGQYMAGVKQTLALVEVELQRRGLEAAKADFLKALRNVERRDVTDDHFAEAGTALTVLEKTVEATGHRRDPAIAAVYADARTLTRDGKATLARRRGEVDVLRQRNKVREVKAHTEEAVKQIQASDAGEEQFKAAEQAILLLKGALTDGAPFLKKDREYAQYDREVKDRIAELERRIAARRITASAREAKEQLAAAITDARGKNDVIAKPEATDADVEAAEKSVQALQTFLEAHAELEGKDASYASRAATGLNELVRQSELLAARRKAHQLRKTTGEAVKTANAAVEAARSSQDIRKQKASYAKAVAAFRVCAEESGGELKRDEKLAQVEVPVAGELRSAAELVAHCGDRLKEVERSLQEVAGLVAFDDGPKKFYEAAKDLMGRSRRPEAITQLNECIVAARRAQFDYPQLRERKFVVAGSQVTVVELIRICIKERDALEK